MQRKGQSLQQRLNALPKVKSVSGLGLMIGVEFEEGILASDIVTKCIEQGVLFLTAKSKLRLLPLLIISDEQIEQGIKVLKEVLESR